MNLKNEIATVLLFLFVILSSDGTARGEDPWLVFEAAGEANGKHVVFVSGL